jgi:eukaryotic-like serine/threonine-protein kinase
VLVPAIGHVVANRYALQQVIGRGGMGEVWRAHDQDLDSPCAIKFIVPHLANDRGTRERFVREARAVARLSSPHVVHVLGVGEEDGILYLAQQLLEGETLRSRLRRIGKLDPPSTLALAEQVGDALENAHDAGIVHRDLKPENIWCWSGNKMFAKVLDFGVAKSALTSQSLKTATGALLGTPQYMSPEQALGDQAVDHCSDLWALALIIVECLTSKRPFDSSGLGNLLMEIVSGRVPPLKQLGPELPGGLESWWARALARDPRARFQSAAELVSPLRQYLAHPSAEWLAAQRAGDTPREAVLKADASRDTPSASSVSAGEPLTPPHVTMTYAPDRMSSGSQGGVDLENPSRARPSNIDPGGERLPAASVAPTSRSEPGSPRTASGRRSLVAAGLVTLVIVVILVSVRRFIVPHETGAKADVAGAATSPGVPVEATRADTASGAPERDVQTRGSEVTGPAAADEGPRVRPVGPSAVGPAPPAEPSTEPGARAATKAPQPAPRAPGPTAADQLRSERRVEVVDPLTEKEPETMAVTSKGDDVANDVAPVRAVADPLGLRADGQGPAGETSAADEARKKRLEELERQLGISPDRDDKGTQ